MVTGQYINMSSIAGELEQQFECGRLGGQLEQQPDELEQQCGLSRGLWFHPQTLNRDSGATGIYCPALGEINFNLLFGRRQAEDQEVYLSMKRTGNLFETIFSSSNLYLAYLDARKGKRKKMACFEFEKHLGANLQALYEELHNGTYRPRSYFRFIVYEPKERVIYAPAFRDIVVQHAIYRIIYAIFDRTFINTSFACRIGYGTHRASKYTQGALRVYSGDHYTLKLDIRKFFYSINRKILRSLIERKIKDKHLIDVMMMFADLDEPVGIPIGNLLSQIYALIYLNPVDHFIKRVLKIKHYVRYVDDFILIGLTRPQCLLYRKAIVDFLRENLGLVLSKSTISKIKHGINFVGYRTWRSKRFIRKYSLYKFKRMVQKQNYQAIVSLLGHAKNTNSINYMLKILKEAPNAENIYR